MTDGLVDLTMIWSAVQAVYDNYGGYLAIILGIYLGLFMVGLVIEAVQSSRNGT